VERSLTELENGGLTFGPSKTEAGRRTVAYPELISPAVRWHLSCFAQADVDSLIFTGPAGAALRRGNFRRRVWLSALRDAGLPMVHFYVIPETT
jgi:hypothetical protein